MAQAIGLTLLANKNMKLFQSESLLTSSDADTIVLTTHRIRNNAGGIIKNAMLNQVPGISAQFSQQPIFLIAAILTGLFGPFLLTEQEVPIAMLLLLTSAVFIFLFIRSRKHLALISTSGISVLFHTKGMSKSDVMDFIYKVEDAISKTTS